MKSKSLINILPLNFRLKCIMDIEANISVPKKGFFTKTAQGCRICYSINNQLKYIYIHAGEETAGFLHKFGIIDSYALVNNQVKMYAKTLITITGPKGEPVQMTRFVPVTLDEINLTESQVVTIAAIHEYEQKGKVMGIVVNMLCNTKAA